MGHRPVGLRPDLRAGGRVVRGRVLLLAYWSGCQPPGISPASRRAHAVVGVRWSGATVRGTPRPRTRTRAAPRSCPGLPCPGRRTRTVAALRRDDREADPVLPEWAPRSCTRPQRAARLGRRDHPQRDAVLTRSARVEVFDLASTVAPGMPGSPTAAGPAGCSPPARSMSHGPAWCDAIRADTYPRVVVISGQALTWKNPTRGGRPCEPDRRHRPVAHRPCGKGSLTKHPPGRPGVQW